MTTTEQDEGMKHKISRRRIENKNISLSLFSHHLLSSLNCYINNLVGCWECDFAWQKEYLDDSHYICPRKMLGITVILGKEAKFPGGMKDSSGSSLDIRSRWLKGSLIAA